MHKDRSSVKVQSGYFGHDQLKVRERQEIVLEYKSSGMAAVDDFLPCRPVAQEAADFGTGQITQPPVQERFAPGDFLNIFVAERVSVHGRQPDVGNVESVELPGRALPSFEGTVQVDDENRQHFHDVRWNASL